MFLIYPKCNSDFLSCTPFVGLTYQLSCCHHEILFSCWTLHLRKCFQFDKIKIHYNYGLNCSRILTKMSIHYYNWIHSIRCFLFIWGYYSLVLESLLKCQSTLKIESTPYGAFYSYEAITHYHSQMIQCKEKIWNIF